MRNKWITCDHCDGTGKDKNGMGGYCDVCCGHPEINIHNPVVDKRRMTPWRFIENREQLRNKWITFRHSIGMGDWDYYEEPFEYPCLARFSVHQVADGSGISIDFVYKSDIKLFKDEENHV